MKTINLIITVIIIMIIAGCTSNESKITTDYNDFSFENPNIIAYIDGDPVDEVAMSNYITMKKIYIEAVKKRIEGYSDTDTNDLIFQERILVEWDMERTKEQMSYSEEELEERLF